MTLFFHKFMRDKEICREVLEILLQFKISKIEYIEYQKTINVVQDAKGVRLDVYDSDSNKVYNVEMQVGKAFDLAKRCRYYEATIDADMMERGAMYDTVKDSFIIFICTFDPFNKNLPCYTFKNFCSEDKELALDDGRHIVFFNTKSLFRRKRQ